MEDVASRIVEAPGAWDIIVQNAPYLVVFLGFTIWVMRHIREINDAARHEVKATHEEHAKDLVGMMEQSAKREDRLSVAFERNTRIMSRVLERLHEPDPPEG
jgi:hypothetical protein